ncbi:hypothetical protein METUNv1_01348 [Methyloversatilis universalis FAM5]|uniref:Uncharacterized protein n=1 Tax=Methyloversatilis universalis (strain ATCC BAA-1314 / DSM 25237 / JCM 13912 / CCUG 52030 / FAM5) TaxID=1000565 RepID=F5RAR3_METUF|nr:hypothetical protein METUNv1_01348 [Methyloversatilis universalis FAM5]
MVFRSKEETSIYNSPSSESSRNLLNVTLSVPTGNTNCVQLKELPSIILIRPTFIIGLTVKRIKHCRTFCAVAQEGPKTSK